MTGETKKKEEGSSSILIPVKRQWSHSTFPHQETHKTVALGCPKGRIDLSQIFEKKGGGGGSHFYHKRERLLK